MANQLMTPQGLDKLKPGEWKSDSSPDHTRGAGRLWARCTGSGIVFYARFTAPDGSRQRIPLGAYHREGKVGGLSLAEARARFGELSKRYTGGDRDLRAALAADGAARAAEAEHQRLQAEAEAARRAGTVGLLLDAYVDHLRAKGKASHKDVGSLFTCHVLTARPDLWLLPAPDLSDDHVVDLQAPLVKAGKLRTADKLRTCIGAAYQFAIRSRRVAGAPAGVRALRIHANPAAGIGSIEGSRNTRSRALSVAELRSYWRRVRKLPPVDCALLTLHLLTGAQRVQQLARATLLAWDRDDDTLLLMDPKGRRREPRRHAVPLLPDAVHAVTTMTAAGGGDYVFSLSGGLSPATYDQLAARIRMIADAMVEAGEAASTFTPGDLRRTVETRLAALGVPEEVRAQLQSHGLSGVQTRHYNRHAFLPEKRAALEHLLALVSGRPGTVTPLRRRAAK